MLSVSLITETASPLSTLARQWQQASCYHPCLPFIDFECSSQKELLKVMIILPTFPHLMALSPSGLLKNPCWFQFLWEQRWNSLAYRFGFFPKTSILHYTPVILVSSVLHQIHHQFSSVTQSCLTLLDPMNRSTPGLPVHHQLPEFTQTHVHRVTDAIQPSHPLSSSSPPAPNPSQHQSLFQWVNSSHEAAKVVEFQLQHHSLQRNPRADLLQNGLVGSPCSPRDSQESSPTPNTPYSFPNLNYIKIYISLQLECSSSHAILILQISGLLAPL